MNDKVNFPQNAIPLTNGVSIDLVESVKTYDSKSLYWLSGYCSGLADAKSGLIEYAASKQLDTNNITQLSQNPAVALKTQILYATQSGNSESIARKLYKRLEGQIEDLSLLSTADFKTKALKEIDLILIVASTHGEGEPPDDAIDFHEFIFGKRAPKLTGTQHAVLSLGDSSYEFFCQTGKDFDQAFTKLGSQALVPRVDCDLDFEELAEKWISDVVQQVVKVSNSSASDSFDNGAFAIDSKANSTSSWTKQNPFTATILENQRITGRDSSKIVHHLEISLEDSGLVYEPGDSLGVWAKNKPELVREIIETVELDKDEIVEVDGVTKSLFTALSENFELTLITKDFIKAFAELTKSELVSQLLETNFKEYISNHQLIDIFKLAPTKLTAGQLTDLLKPIKPRMYSISSSLDANPEEVHLTVGLVESSNESGVRHGAASHFLIETLEEGDEVLIFVDPNNNFKLPSDDVPAIMIGPGTGIAPFRAFLQQREEAEAKGGNWLFFGNPNFNTDFLYQTELQELLKNDVLTKLDVAFSRDQENKFYVQDRLKEKAVEVWEWVNQYNASIYICGDMNRMAKDVECALLEIFERQGKMSSEEAKEYLKSLRNNKRYQKDVY